MQKALTKKGKQRAICTFSMVTGKEFRRDDFLG
jgi:hypothetical protein